MVIESIAEALEFHELPNIVVDPVMVATSGARLLEISAVDVLRNKLIPLAKVITPNIYEAEILAQQSIKTIEVNLEPTPVTPIVDVALIGRAGEILPKIVKNLNST